MYLWALACDFLQVWLTSIPKTAASGHLQTGAEFAPHLVGCGGRLSPFTSGVSVLRAALHRRQGLGKLRPRKEGAEQAEAESRPPTQPFVLLWRHLPPVSVEETEAQILLWGRGCLG